MRVTLSKNEPAYLGLLFLNGSLRGRVPVALGRCFHCVVFVVVLQEKICLLVDFKQEIEKKTTV